jgi:hypothetical protein
VKVQRKVVASAIAIIAGVGALYAYVASTRNGADSPVFIGEARMAATPVRPKALEPRRAHEASEIPPIAAAASAGSENLWGIVSDDGTTFLPNQAARALSGAEAYTELLEGVTLDLDVENQRRITDVVATALTDLHSDASIYEMACSSRMCVGSVVLPSHEAAKSLARSLSDSRHTSGIYRVMLDSDQSSSGLRKFLLVTDPTIQRSLLTVSPDFPSPSSPSPELIEALGKSAAPAKAPPP